LALFQGAGIVLQALPAAAGFISGLWRLLA